MRKIIRTILGKRIYYGITQKIITNSINKVIAQTHSGKKKYTAQEAIDLLFSPQAKFIKPWQHTQEILEVAKLIESKRPKTILEIGTASGGTLFLSALLADPNALIISIDLEFGMYGGGYPDWKIPIYKSFGQEKQKIELIRGDSHSKEIINQLESILNGRKIDYLFIDGDHTYEGVKEDFDVYSKFLNKNAFVAFHDIVSDKAEVPDHFVSVFWNDIKSNYKYKEFIKDPNQNKLGLGVLFIGE